MTVPGERTHCPQGHPYDELNTRVYRGRRYCRECGRIANRTYQRKSEPPACVVDGCDNAARTKRMCARHYSQSRRGKRPDEVQFVQRGSRLLVAQTCSVCGAFKSAAEFQNRETRCRECRLTAQHRYQDANRAAIYTRRIRRERRANSLSLEFAVHHREQWTGADLEVLATSRLVEADLAAVLGRSRAAVRAQKALLTRDPRKQAMAGLVNRLDLI